MSDTSRRTPAPTPTAELPAVRARRRRRRRARIVLQLVVSAAAIWFVTHPSAFPTLPDAEPLTPADSGSADSSAVDGSPTDGVDAAGGTTSFDTTTDDSPFGSRHRRSAGTGALSVPPSHLPATRLLPRLPRLVPRGRLFRSIEERARAGERVAVSVTAYCLQGTTRRGNPVRDGIIAVDRALFPLGREVELFFGRKRYGRFMADDTGGAITGGRIDVWMSDCAAARRFGRRRGYAQSVPREP